MHKYTKREDNMSLNARKIKSPANANRVEQPPIDPGSYPARVVQVLDLGVQPQNAYKGEEKPPAHEIMLTYELLDEFCVDKDGNPDEEKPRWMSETFPLHSLEMDLAKSTKRYKAIDPTEMYDGDFTLLVDTPCMVNLINKQGTGKNADRIYTNVSGVAAMRPKEAAKAPELVNPTKVFVLDEPDMEVFGSLPEWLQEKIKSNLTFKGSPLEAALSGKPKAQSKDEPEDAAVVQEDDSKEAW